MRGMPLTPWVARSWKEELAPRGVPQWLMERNEEIEQPRTPAPFDKLRRRRLVTSGARSASRSRAVNVSRGLADSPGPAHASKRVTT